MDTGVLLGIVAIITITLNEENEVYGRYDFEEIEKLNKNHLEGIDYLKAKLIGDFLLK